MDVVSLVWLLGKEHGQISKHKFVLIAKKSMKFREVNCVLVEIAFAVLYFCLILAHRFDCCLIQPYQQISYVEFGLCALDQENLSHCVQLYYLGLGSF